MWPGRYLCSALRLSVSRLSRLLGGIDLSIGSVVTLVNIGAAWLMVTVHMDPMVASIVTLIMNGKIVKKLIVYDLDGTLAESKSSLDTEMSALLHDLLGIVKVAVISGGDWPQFEKQLLSDLPHDERLVNLSLLPTCGTKFYQYAGEWKKIYEEDFAPGKKRKLLVLSPRRSLPRASRSKRSGERKSKTGEARSLFPL